MIFEYVIISRESPPEPCKNQSPCIPIPQLHFENVAAGNDFCERNSEIIS